MISKLSVNSGLDLGAGHTGWNNGPCFIPRQKAQVQVTLGQITARLSGANKLPESTMLKRSVYHKPNQRNMCMSKAQGTIGPRVSQWLNSSCRFHTRWRCGWSAAACRCGSEVQQRGEEWEPKPDSSLTANNLQACSWLHPDLFWSSLSLSCTLAGMLLFCASKNTRVIKSNYVQTIPAKISVSAIS